MGYSWHVLVLLYNLGGPVVGQVPTEATPYRGRDAKFVVHFKHQWNEGDAEAHDDLLKHHQGMSQALETHLPCQGFYNYMDGSLPCAQGDSDKWLEAYFADVPPMKAQAPDRRLQARLKFVRASDHTVDSSTVTDP